MLKDLWDLTSQVLTLAKDMERMRQDIKETKQDVLKLTLAMQRLTDEIVLSRQQQQSAHENLKLQMQVEQLKFERRLPPAKAGSEGV